jgi:predicted RNase H-like HicB family nuclease
MRRFTVLLYPEENGCSALVPVLGVATQGETVEEALAMARDIIDVTVRGLIEDNEPIPEEETPPMVVTVDVTIPVEATASVA